MTINQFKYHKATGRNRLTAELLHSGPRKTCEISESVENHDLGHEQLPKELKEGYTIYEEAIS